MTKSPLLSAVLAGLMLGFSIGLLAGAAIRNNVMRTQAIERGHAHWEVDKAGNKTFTWNEPKVEESE